MIQMAKQWTTLLPLKVHMMHACVMRCRAMVLHAPYTMDSQKQKHQRKNVRIKVNFTRAATLYVLQYVLAYALAIAPCVPRQRKAEYNAEINIAAEKAAWDKLGSQQN